VGGRLVVTERKVRVYLDTGEVLEGHLDAPAGYGPEAVLVALSEILDELEYDRKLGAA